MPNKRKAGKVRWGYFITGEERCIFHASAERLGMNQSDFIKFLALKAAYEEQIISRDELQLHLSELPSLPTSMMEKTMTDAGAATGSSN